MKANETVTITLTQSIVKTDTAIPDLLFKITKLVGAVEVYSNVREETVSHHVGDVLSIAEARSISRVGHYVVHVTAEKE
jgi:ribosomal protein S17